VDNDCASGEYTLRVVDERERRIVVNETLFREVNERIKGLNQSFATLTDEMLIVCECGAGGCAERFPMRPEEYEELRSNPDHFAIVPGHEIPDVERIVSRCGAYDVVAKLPGEAQQIAEETDPRAAS
jgi:hypothetical protein